MLHVASGGAAAASGSISSRRSIASAAAKTPTSWPGFKKAIAGTDKMYALARQIIEPGITEIEVFNRLQAAAVEEFGEMLTGTGNDYQCGARGGPPRNNRKAQDGELYILDLGPAFRGYFADNCRAIAVNRKPTDEQQTAWTLHHEGLRARRDRR